MGVSLHIVVFALFSVSLAAESGRGHPEWRTEILKGVEKVDFRDQMGRMRVHGENTEVILAVSDLEPILAAAELGQGRVLAFAGNKFVWDVQDPERGGNEQLNENLRSWMTRGKYSDVGDICVARKLDNRDLAEIPSTCKALLWSGAFDESEAFYKNLIQYVKNGGGLVTGYDSWKLRRWHPGRTNLEWPVARILEEIGITLITYFNYGEVYTIDENMLKWAENSHILNMFQHSNAEPEKLEGYKDDILRVLNDCSRKSFDNITHGMVDILCHSMDCIPKKTKNLVKGIPAVSLMNKVWVKYGILAGEKKAPAVKFFPGDYDEPPTLTSATYSASVKGNEATSFPTGYHLPAGQELVVSWSSAPSKNWQIMIDGHDDTLYHRETLTRWPEVQMIRNLETSPLKFSSPFGGNIYLTSPVKVTEEMTIKLENVVESPIFRVGEGDKWESEMRNKPGLWADLVGENITITMPSSSIRKLPDPTSAMKLWDEVVGVMNDLCGYNPSLGRGQWIIADQQIYAGLMHAGYPIVVGLSWAIPDISLFLLNETEVKAGTTWGLFHELGHMMQERVWTWSGMSEVTTNIFTLYAMDVIAGIKPFTHHWLTSGFDDYKKYFEDGARYDQYYANAARPLVIYAQLARDLGWNTYKAVFTSYIGLSPDKFPEDIDEIDEWIIRFSKESGKSVVPAYDFWGFTIRDRVIEALKGLPPYLPDDVSTKEWASERAQKIRAKYNMEEK